MRLLSPPHIPPTHPRKIYTYFPLKTVFLFVLLCFEAGSLICALAPSSPNFILDRVIAGVGGTSIFGGGMILIQLAVPLSRISVYLSILSSMYGIAAMTGPPLGGVFTSIKKLTCMLICASWNFLLGRLYSRLIAWSIWWIVSFDDIDCCS
jgi:MFS family permease